MLSRLFKDPKNPSKSGPIPINFNRRFKPVNFCFSHKKHHTTRTIQVKPKTKDLEQLIRTNSEDTVDDEGESVFVRPTILDSPMKHTIHVGSSKHRDRNKPESEDEDMTVKLNWKGIEKQSQDKTMISRQLFYFQKQESKIKKILVKPKPYKEHNHSHNQERETRPHHIQRKPQQTTHHKYHVSDIPWFDKTPPPEAKRNKLFYWRDRW